jgi:hypothetical protein
MLDLDAEHSDTVEPAAVGGKDPASAESQSCVCYITTNAVCSGAGSAASVRVDLEKLSLGWSARVSVRDLRDSGQLRPRKGVPVSA